MELKVQWRGENREERRVDGVLSLLDTAAGKSARTRMRLGSGQVWKWQIRRGLALP